MSDPNDPRAGLAEITAKALVLGVLLSVVLSAANAYLGLKVGMTVSASIPAAVVSMGLLALFRNHTILENNLVQTAASAGESLAAGVIFTIPALVMIGHWKSFDYLQITMIAGLGGLLGVLFTVPLRRALVVPGELTFPEGVATAAVLETGDAAVGSDESDEGSSRSNSGLKVILWGALGGGLFKLGQAGLGLFTATAEVARKVGDTVLYFGSDLSPALLSVGYIVRLNIACLVFAGGFISWYIAIPIYYAMHGGDYADMAAADAAWTIWNTKIRYLGVGAMVVGGLWALVSLRGALLSGITSGLKAVRERGQGDRPARRDTDLPMNWVLAAALFGIVPLFGLYWHVTGELHVSLLMAVVMTVAGFLFSAVAGYMAGLVGASNNPISGITIATILFASLLLFVLLGSDAGVAGAASAIFIGGVVCCAAAIAGDNMQDLKAGHLVGATPWKQQVMQVVGVLAAALVMAPVLSLLHTAYGFVGAATPSQTEPLAAPQAGLMASVAQGVFAQNLPWTMIALGGLIAVVVIAVDETLERRGAGWRTPVLAVAVGIYLPFELAVPILLGGLLAHFADRATGGDEESAHGGLLVASGLITGEALVGIGLAIPIAIAGRTDVLSIVDEPLGSWPGIVLLAAVAWFLWRAASQKANPAPQASSSGDLS
ncbi:MAG TPA: oligopeptide transporter, OPT family [Deltaproteobacteria bacterium]|nr:oligopeptide transporter, OPT family [Deltaproteobacteria bacterium]